MKRSMLAGAIAYFFILLFLYTGIEKLMEIHSFRDQLVNSPLLGPVAGIVAWGLPITEILLAIILFIPAWQLRGLYGSLALMTIFTIYLIILLSIDNNLVCSCGGIIENLSPKQHVYFNLAAIVLAILGILAARRQQDTLRFRWWSTAGSGALLLTIGWILFTAFRAPAKVRTGYEGRLLPEFSILLPDSVSHLNTADIPTGKPFIMVGFSPWCTHCQGEMLDIIHHINRFGDTTIYFVTPYPYADMKKFYDAFQIKKYPNIVLGVDAKDTFMRYFKVHYIPYTTIYDSRKRLKAVIPGQADAALLGQTLDD